MEKRQEEDDNDEIKTIHRMCAFRNSSMQCSLAQKFLDFDNNTDNSERRETGRKFHRIVLSRVRLLLLFCIVSGWWMEMEKELLIYQKARSTLHRIEGNEKHSDATQLNRNMRIHSFAKFNVHIWLLWYKPRIVEWCICILHVQFEQFIFHGNKG